MHWGWDILNFFMLSEYGTVCQICFSTTSLFDWTAELNQASIKPRCLTAIMLSSTHNPQPIKQCGRWLSYFGLLKTARATTFSGKLCASTRMNCFSVLVVFWAAAHRKFPENFALRSATRVPFKIETNITDMETSSSVPIRDSHKDKTVLFIPSTSIANTWVYVRHVLSRAGRIRLSAESIVKIVPPPSFDPESLIWCGEESEEEPSLAKNSSTVTSLI